MLSVYRNVKFCCFEEFSSLILNVSSFKHFSMTYCPLQGLASLEVVPTAIIR